MADDRLSAEISLDANKWNLAVASVIQSSQALENAVDRLSKEIESTLQRGLDQVSKKLDTVDFSKTIDGIEGVNQKLGTLSFDALSRQLDQAAASMQAAFSSVLTPASEFEAQLRRVNTIAKLNDEQLGRFGDQLSVLGQQLGVGVGPTETLAGAYEVLSARQETAAGTTQILSTALIAASASGVPTATAVDVLTSVLNSYGLAATDATRVSDVLFKTADIGKTTFEQLAPVIGNVAPLAAEAGVSIEELGAAVAVLTKSGISTPTAIESTRAAIAALAAPTREGAKVAAEYGIVLDDNFLKSRGLAGALQEIQAKTGGSATAIRKIIGDVSGFNAVLKLTANGGKDFGGAIKANFDAAGASANASAQRQKTFQAAMERLAAAGERLAVSLGKSVIPIFTKLVDAAAQAVDFFNESIPDYLKFTGLVTAGFVTLGVTGAAALAGIVAAGGAIITTLTGATASAAAFSVAGVTVAESWALANASVSAAAASISGMAGVGLLVSAAFAAVAGVVIGAGIALAAYTKITQDNTKAQEELLAIEERRAAALREGKDLVGKSAAELRAQGKTAADLVDVIGGLMDRAEQLRREDPGNTAALKSVNDQIARLQAVKAELAADPPKVPEPDTSVLHQSLKEQNKANQDAERAREDRIANEIQAIEIARVGDEQKIARFKKLLKEEQLEGDERRRIISEIYNLENKLIVEKAKKKKAAEDAAFDQELQNVQHSKKSIDDQIVQLEQLAKKYESNGDRRRKVEDELKKLQDQRAKEAEDLLKRQADAEQQAAEARKAQSEGKTADLERARDRGEDVADQLIAQRRKQGEEQIKAIEAKLKEDLAKEKDKTIRVKLEDTAKINVKNAEAETDRDVQAIRDQDVQDKANKRQDELAVEKEIGNARIEALKEQLATGKDVTKQLEAETIANLKREEEALKAKAAADIAATDDAIKQGNIQKQLVLDLFNAKKAATEELNKQSQLWDEIRQKTEAAKAAERGPIQGAKTGSFDFTLGGVSSDASILGFAGGTDAAFKARQAKTLREAQERRNRALTGAGVSQDLLNQTSGIPGLTTVAQTKKPNVLPATPKAAGLTLGRAAAQKVDVAVSFGKATVDVIVKDSNGRETQRKSVPLPTSDGRSSEEGKHIDKLSGKHGTNVR